jgi:hypothetical protein
MPTKESVDEQKAFYLVLHIIMFIAAAFILHFGIKNAYSLYKAWKKTNDEISKRYSVVPTFGLVSGYCENGYCDEVEDYMLEDNETLANYYNKYNKDIIRAKMAIHDETYTRSIINDDMKDVIKFRLDHKVDAKIDKMPTVVSGTGVNQTVIPDESKLTSGLILANPKEDTYVYEKGDKEDTGFFSYLLSGEQIKKSRDEQQQVIDQLARKVRELESYYRR